MKHECPLKAPETSIPCQLKRVMLMAVTDCNAEMAYLTPRCSTLQLLIYIRINEIDGPYCVSTDSIHVDIML